MLKSTWSLQLSDPPPSLLSRATMCCHLFTIALLVTLHGGLYLSCCLWPSLQRHITIRMAANPDAHAMSRQHALPFSWKKLTMGCQVWTFHRLYKYSGKSLSYRGCYAETLRFRSWLWFIGVSYTLTRMPQLTCGTWMLPPQTSIEKSICFLFNVYWKLK